jgi:SAM-dependent methyltransferase
MSRAEDFARYVEMREKRYARWIDPASGMAVPPYVEPADCPVCGADACRARFVKRGFQWCSCGRCRAIYVNPALTREAQRLAYRGEDANFYYRNLALSDRSSEGWRAELDLVHRFQKPPGRLLDIACGRGAFLAVAKKAGWQARGVEVNPVAAAAGRSEFGVAIEPIEFEEAQFEPASFEVVTIFQTLDQFTAPARVLQRARDLLVPGGLLAVSVPNVRSFMVWAVGKHHRHYTPEKMVSLTPKTLRRMFKTSGFARVESCSTFGEEISLSNIRDLWRTGCKVDLFECRLATEDSWHPSRRRLSRGRQRSAWKSALRPVDNALVWTTRVLGLGSYMRAYARAPRA